MARKFNPPRDAMRTMRLVNLVSPAGMMQLLGTKKYKFEEIKKGRYKGLIKVFE